MLGTDHYFSTGGSHFGKINCLHTKRKKLSAEKFIQKNCLQNTGKIGKSIFL